MTTRIVDMSTADLKARLDYLLERAVRVEATQASFTAQHQPGDIASRSMRFALDSVATRSLDEYFDEAREIQTELDRRANT